MEDRLGTPLGATGSRGSRHGGPPENPFGCDWLLVEGLEYSLVILILTRVVLGSRHGGPPGNPFGCDRLRIRAAVCFLRMVGLSGKKKYPVDR